MGDGLKITITFVGEYRPGDMPPEGYLQWHEWANVQHKAGLKQKRCCNCSLWRYPQEMSDKTRVGSHKTASGKTVTKTYPLCKKCTAK